MEKHPAFDKFTLNAVHSLLSMLLFIPLFMITIVSDGQKFPANTIQDSLKENAEVVIRLQEIMWDIKSAGQATIKMHFVYTILNEKGDGYAEYRSVYNSKSRLINSINGYLYDASGKEIGYGRFSL